MCVYLCTIWTIVYLLCISRYIKENLTTVQHQIYLYSICIIINVGFYC
jgi:hypothetical protein